MARIMACFVFKKALDINAAAGAVLSIKASGHALLKKKTPGASSNKEIKRMNQLFLICITIRPLLFCHNIMPAIIIRRTVHKAATGISKFSVLTGTICI